MAVESLSLKLIVRASPFPLHLFCVVVSRLASELAIDGYFCNLIESVEDGQNGRGADRYAGVDCRAVRLCTLGGLWRMFNPCCWFHPWVTHSWSLFPQA